MRVEQKAYLYLGAFVDGLVGAGLRNVVICPGSRSTPLAMRMADHPQMKIWMHVDERSAAFFALGMAKASGEPVAVLCSSGTAGANFFPAVVEARYARVPLVVLTADRPHELREVGAPQVIDQLHLYGHHVKWFAEMALPESSEPMLRYARQTASRAVNTSLGYPQGPVHLNFPFREPLVPLPPEEGLLPEEATNGPDAGRATVRVHHGHQQLLDEQLHPLVQELGSASRPLIVAGPMPSPATAAELVALAEALDVPLLADPLSHVRTVPGQKRRVVDAYDAMLRDAQWKEQVAPDLVLRFGAMPVSKPLLQYLEYHRPTTWVVDEGGEWLDPTLLVNRMIYASPALFCRKLQPLLPRRPGSPWTELWLEANSAVQGAMEQKLNEFVEREELFEGQVFRELARILPEEAVLYVGNSMPIRDADTFFPRVDKQVRILANRGANGIDGVVSSALGAGAALKKPLTLVIGDLSFYHDLNGLLAAKWHKIPATVVLIHNDGGGIFSFLPQAQYPEHFEMLFGTPTGLNFQGAVEMYGGHFVRANNWEEFRRAYQEEVSGWKVIEISTRRDSNVSLHGEVWTAVAEELSRLLAAWKEKGSWS